MSEKKPKDFGLDSVTFENSKLKTFQVRSSAEHGRVRVVQAELEYFSK